MLTLSFQSESCEMGRGFQGDLQASVGDAARYVDGNDVSWVSGPVGLLDIEVAGVTVRNQEIALVDEANWLGDNQTSGVMGLGYPITTQVYKESDQDNVWEPGSPAQMKYDPIFTSMVKQGLTSNQFSLAMDKTTGQGYLSFGGLPPVNHASDFGKTPIRNVVSSWRKFWVPSQYL
jgi:hypothetical protein